MTLIRLNDNSNTVINLNNIEYMNLGYTENRNPCYTIQIGFISGNTKQLIYDQKNMDTFEEDVKYISGFMFSR